MAARVLALYTRAVASGEGALPSADREELSARSVVAADTLGSAADVEAASTAHAALVASLPKAKSASGKRAADGAPAGSAAKQVRERLGHGCPLLLLSLECCRRPQPSSMLMNALHGVSPCCLQGSGRAAFCISANEASMWLIQPEGPVAGAAAQAPCPASQ